MITAVLDPGGDIIVGGVSNGDLALGEVDSSGDVVNGFGLYGGGEGRSGERGRVNELAALRPLGILRLRLFQQLQQTANRPEIIAPVPFIFPGESGRVNELAALRPLGILRLRLFQQLRQAANRPEIIAPVPFLSPERTGLVGIHLKKEVRL